MRSGVPWSVKGIEPEAREAAKIAARREGKTLGQWLNEKIIETAADEEDADMSAPGVTAPRSSNGNSMAAQALQIDFSPVTDALRDLVHRLERSERRSENALTGLDETLADMAQRLERTERLSGALGDGGHGLDQTLADLRARLEKSERGLERAELLNTDAMRTVERGLRAISTRLEETERRADQAIKHAGDTPDGVRGLKTSLDDLARRLDAAEHAAQTARDQAAQAVSALNTRGGASDDAVKALERAIGNVVDHIEASDARTSKVIAALQSTVDGLASEMTALKAAGDKPTVSVEAIKSLESTMAALQQNIAEVGGRVGQVETAARRDVDQIASAIDDMGGRLDRVREAAVDAARDAARKESGQTAQLVTALEQRLDTTEKASAEAIRTIEGSVSDMAGQMREIAALGSGAGAFAEPLAALERAIEDMGSRLQSTDQRSAKALAKVEEISDELMRKLDGPGKAPEIEQVRAALDDMGARLELMEGRGPGAQAGRDGPPPPPAPGDAWTAPPPAPGPAAPDLAAEADDNPFGPPPPPPGFDRTDTDDPFAAGTPNLGAPPFASAPFEDAEFDRGAETASGGRSDFLESARRAARAAAGNAPAGDVPAGGARSPFAEPERHPIPQLGGSRKSMALIAAGLAVVAVAGLVVVLLGGGPKDVAGPPEGIEVPADSTAALDTPEAGNGAAADAGRGADTAPGTDMAQADAGADETGAPAPGETGETARAPAREMPDMVPPAQAARPDAALTDATLPEAAQTPADAADSTGSGAPTAITPRREVDVAALPEPAARPAPLPRDEPAAAPDPAAPEPAAPQRRTLREAAADGDPAAQYEIGQRYANGTNGVPQDWEQAAFWLTRAAEQGLAPAQYRLGTLYEKGQGVPENPTRARGWYERAAAQGNVKAQHNLAVMQAEGAGGAQDFALAARSFEQAAQAGLADSQYNLAILYERGLGVERDLAKAYTWFSIAGAGGDADAAARAEALKNSVDAAALVDAELAARTFSPRASDPAANEVAWQAEAPATATVREVQSLLGSLGYDAGPADGIAGGQTIDAVRQFERDRGLAVTGRIDARLLDALKQAAI